LPGEEKELRSFIPDLFPFPSGDFEKGGGKKEGRGWSNDRSPVVVVKKGVGKVIRDPARWPACRRGDEEFRIVNFLGAEKRGGAKDSEKPENGSGNEIKLDEFKRGEGCFAFNLHQKMGKKNERSGRLFSAPTFEGRALTGNLAVCFASRRGDRGVVRKVPRISRRRVGGGEEKKQSERLQRTG